MFGVFTLFSPGPLTRFVLLNPGGTVPPSCFRVWRSEPWREEATCPRPRGWCGAEPGLPAPRPLPLIAGLSGATAGSFQNACGHPASLKLWSGPSACCPWGPSSNSRLLRETRLFDDPSRPPLFLLSTPWCAGRKGPYITSGTRSPFCLLSVCDRPGLELHGRVGLGSALSTCYLCALPAAETQHRCGR